MKLVATIAALGLAGVSTSACAQEFKGPVNIPIDDPVSAQTAKCLLSVEKRFYTTHYSVAATVRPWRCCRRWRRWSEAAAN